MNKNSLTLLAIAVCCMTVPLFAQQPLQRSLLLQVNNVTMDQLAKTGFLLDDEHPRQTLISLVRDTALVLATTAEAEVLRERGFNFTVVLQDSHQVQLYRRALYGPSFRLSPPYHTYATIISELDSLQRRHPSVLQVLPIGTTSQEKKTIYAAKISHQSGNDADRPSILFNGCHHANEIMGAEICMAIIQQLAGRYGTDPDITRWVNRFNIYVVPVVNVDGYEIVTSGKDPRWRKNTRDTNGNGILHEFPEGVDLNRNYDFNWAHGGSGDSTSERYRGPFPFSESETRAMADLAKRERFLLSITYHSQGEVIYYPWNWAGHKAPDDKLLTDIARGLAGSITSMRGDTCYRAEYGAGLVGQTYPWLYGTLGTFDFVVETGSGASIFPPYEIPGIVKANLVGARYLLAKGEGPGLSGHIRDAQTGAPIEAELWFPTIDTEEIHRRTSEPQAGRFWRLLNPGAYSCIISSKGYHAVVLKDLEVESKGWTNRDVFMQREAP